MVGMPWLHLAGLGIRLADFPHGYQTVKRFVHRLRGSTEPQAVGIIQTVAGEEAQVDYGSGPMVKAIRKAVNTDEHDCLRADAGATAASRYGCWSGGRVPVSGPSCTRKPFVDWVGVRASVVLGIICAKESSLRTSTIPRSIHSFRDVLAFHTALGGHAVPDQRSRSQRESGSRCRTRAENAAQRTAVEEPEEAEAYLDRWEERWADTRIHGTDETASRGHVQQRKNHPC